MKRTWIRAIGFATILAWASATFSAEQPKRSVPPKLPAGVKFVPDLQYVEGGHERNRLDLYLPEKVQGPLPIIVWIHGGGWYQGSKENGVPTFLYPAVPLSAKGYAVACINYRLSQHALFPAQIQDCKAAIRWLRANAAKYHLDPDHVGVWGASAGGHLAAMLGTTASVKEFEGAGGNLDQSSQVQAVIDWCGPVDLSARMSDLADKCVTGLIGGPAKENRSKVLKASPITYVGKDAAPFLIMQGDKDNLMPLAQSEMLAEALRKAGVEVTIKVLKDTWHVGPAFSSPESYKIIEDFFGKHLRASAARQKQRD